MRIEIDTNRDGKQEIRKVIRLLLSLVGEGNVSGNEPEQRNIFSKQPEERNIFANPQPAPPPPSPEAPIGALFDSLDSATQTREQPSPPSKDDPDIEVY